MSRPALKVSGILAAAVVLLFALAELLLAWFVFLGSNWARTVTMLLSTTAIGLQAE